MATKFKAIGRNVRRIDGYDKVSGKGLYTKDMSLPHMLYAKSFCSPYGHAKIKSMDTSKAEALPGVRAILKYNDPWVTNMDNSSLYMNAGMYTFGDTTLLPDTCVFWGQPMGVAVCADSEAICDEALKQITFDWEQLPVIVDYNEALQPNASIVRPEYNTKSNENIHAHGWIVPEVFNFGDVDKALATADKIIQIKYKQAENVVAGVEPWSGVAYYHDDRLDMWVHHQCPLDIQLSLAKQMPMPMSKINVHALYQGAMFGGFNWFAYSGIFFGLAAIFSKRTGSPVKALYDGSHFYGGSWEVGEADITVGAMKDGTITAVKAQSIFCLADMLKLWWSTKIPNMSGNGKGVLVNRGPRVCYRDGSQGTCYNHMVFEHVAGELGLDPTKVALLNDGCKGEAMVTLAAVKKDQGFDPNRDSLKECLAIGKTAIDWDNKWHAPGTKILPNGKMHGIGFFYANAWQGWAWAQPCPIGVMFRMDGTVSIIARHADVGVGNETGCCQVAADELGMKFEDVSFSYNEDVGNDAQAPNGSHNALANFTAVAYSARKAKQQLLEMAVSPTIFFAPGPPVITDLKAEDLDIEDSFIYQKTDPTKRWPVGEITLTHWGVWYASNPKVIYERASDIPYFPPGVQPFVNVVDFARQCHFIEVEVDPDTGLIDVTKVVNVNDVGKVINPANCNGQQYGGDYMGLGNSMAEEVYYDLQTGVKLNDNLCSYPILTMLDLGQIDCHLLETGLEYGIYNLGGIGESIGVCTRHLMAPAVYNAIGKYIDDFPITPDKVLKALDKI